jgi:molecular chaperone GrpE
MNKPQNGNEPQTPSAPEPANDELELSNENIVHDKAQMQKFHAEVAELKDRYLRAMAELDNTRKRAEREKADAVQYASTKFAKDLLSVADNFSRALDALKPQVRATLPPEVEAVVAGIEATQRELGSIFERHGIKRIEAQGQRFNPNLHQAVAEVPSRDHAPGTIIAVAQQGYMIGSRLLREAIVAVAAPPAAAAPEGNGSGGYPPTGSQAEPGA